MPRVVPSRVLRLIDSIPLPERNGVVRMNKVDPALLSGLIDLIEQVPEELLTMDNDTYTYFIYAKAQIREILATWTSNRNAGHDPQTFQFSTPTNPLAAIHKAFTKCQDDSPSPGTSELNFITDSDSEQTYETISVRSIELCRMASGKPRLFSQAPQPRPSSCGYSSNAHLRILRPPSLLPDQVES
jgi:hypothetical protein